MKTKTWEITLTFEWDAWDMWNEDEIRSKAKDVLPSYVRILQAEVKQVETNGR